VRAAVGACAIEAAPIVEDAEHNAVGVVLEGERHFGCAAVSCGVRQALLCNFGGRNDRRAHRLGVDPHRALTGYRDQVLPAVRAPRVS
jgi:hypothetical protein